MFHIKKSYFIFLLIFCSVSAASATTLKELDTQVQTFVDSGQSRFTPLGMKKVIAYQGASMLAAEQTSAFSDNNKQPKALQNAITQTLKVLSDAKNNAKVFISTYPELLQLEEQADKAYVYHHKPRMLAEPEVEQYYRDAKRAMAKAIAATERGQLNKAQQASKNAQLAYIRCIDAAMSGLVEQTERALSQATNSGAKRYAPRTWNTAEAELGLLEQYTDDIQRPRNERKGMTRPPKIGYALEMAVYAQKIAIQAKALARDSASYENLILATRQQRLNIAQTLGLKLNYDEVGIDVEPQVIFNAIKALHSEKHQHEKHLLAMQSSFKQDLQAKLLEQRQQDQKSFQSKVSSIKSAFHTKLEQETFEKKRQQKVHALFKQDEADIIVSLDGSLTIRAKKIQFSPNSSKVDGQYFEFLGRIKEALLFYPNRKISIEGHTDSSGDARTNRKLSLQRAEAVQEFLVAAGMQTNRIRALGFGEAKPIASNMYKKGRAMNRRIDIIIQAQQ